MGQKATGLKTIMSDSSAVVISAYNLVPESAKQKEPVRDVLGLTIDPKNFIHNIERLIEAGYEPVSLEDAAKGRAKTFAIIACDGYDLTEQGNLVEWANMNKVPLAFSIPAGLVGVNKPSWTNQIEIALGEALDIANGEKITFTIPGTKQEHSFSNVNEARDLREFVLKSAKPADMDGEEYVRQLCAEFNRALGNNANITPTLDSDSPFDRKMTWAQIRQLQEDGFTIVSHGHTHSNPYTNRDEEGIRNDIRAAKQAFEENGITAPVIMTYPEGKYNEMVRRVAQEEGITVAFTTTAGVITQDSNAYALPRVEPSEYKEHLIPAPAA